MSNSNKSPKAVKKAAQTTETIPAKVTPAFPDTYLLTLQNQAYEALGEWLFLHAPRTVQDLFNAIDGLWGAREHVVTSDLDNEDLRNTVEDVVNSLAVLGDWDSDGCFRLNEPTGERHAIKMRPFEVKGSECIKAVQQ